MLSENLLKVIVCPKCKGELKYCPKKNELRCYRCRLVYRIEEDIPILLVEEAKPLTEDEPCE
ncbi:MAG: Trm112 family protein [Thermotogae bacterium]|nr:Trm112 family protein [Thermotogota bacterium]